MQQVTITGRLGKDPEMQYFQTGKSKTSFSIATSGYDSKKKEKTTNWFSVEIWDNEFVTEHFKKGDSITINGYLKFETYKNSKGEEKENYKIIASKAGYDNALITITGVIQNIEKRFTPQNKQIQILKIEDVNYPVYLFGEVEAICGQFCTFICDLGMVEYKPIAKVIKHELTKPKNPDYGEEEFIDDTQIPF